MKYRVFVDGPDGQSSQAFSTYEEAADYVSFVLDAAAEDDEQPTVKIKREVPGQAAVDGNPGGIEVGTVIERTIGSTDHQFVIEQTEYGYAARYGSKDHFGSRWYHYPSVEFPTKDEAVAYAERFISTAEENAAHDGITEGNPDGIGRDTSALDAAIVANRENPTPENQQRIIDAQAAQNALFESEQTDDFMLRTTVVGNPGGLEHDECFVKGKHVDGCEHLNTIVGGKPGTKVTLNSGEVIYAPTPLEAAEIAAEERALVDGNPGGEPLHESLAEVAAQIDYEAEVVAAAADEVESDEIADAAEKQAEAMDEAAEAVGDAAETAAETAAEVFTETGTATDDVAKTDTPEGEIVSGESDTDVDVPPEPMHWYKRRIGGHN